jgi:hypothetical protein
VSDKFVLPGRTRLGASGAANDTSQRVGSEGADTLQRVIGEADCHLETPPHRFGMLQDQSNGLLDAGFIVTGFDRKLAASIRVQRRSEVASRARGAIGLTGDAGALGGRAVTECLH